MVKHDDCISSREIDPYSTCPRRKEVEEVRRVLSVECVNTYPILVNNPTSNASEEERKLTSLTIHLGSISIESKVLHILETNKELFDDIERNLELTKLDSSIQRQTRFYSSRERETHDQDSMTESFELDEEERKEDEFGRRFGQVGVSLSGSDSLPLESGGDEVRVSQQLAQFHRDVVAVVVICQRVRREEE